MKKTTEEQLWNLLQIMSHGLRRRFMEKGMPGQRMHERFGCHRMADGPGMRGMYGGPGIHGGPGMHGGFGMHGRPGMMSRERVLSVIEGHEDGIRQKEIAEELHINPSSMSELIDKLEKDGDVKRQVDPNDKRATRIHLTELGAARAAEVEDERQDKLEVVFAPLTAEEREQLLVLLRKLWTREVQIPQ